MRNDLITYLGLNSKDFERGVERAKRKVDGFGKTMSNLKKFAVAGFAVGAITEFSKEIFNTALQLEKVDLKARTVFGSSFPKLQAAAKANARAFNFTNSQYKESVTNLADMLKPMGFATDQAFEMSNAVTQMAGVLQQWNTTGGTAMDVANDIRKAMTGSTEVMEKYGINVKDTNEKQKALVKELMETNGLARDQAKAFAIVKTIMESSADAQKFYAENQDSIGVIFSQLNTELMTFKENMVQNVLPVLKQGLKLVNDFFENIRQSRSEGVGSQMVNPFEGIFGIGVKQRNQDIQVKKYFDILSGGAALATDKIETLKDTINELQSTLGNTGGGGDGASLSQQPTGIAGLFQMGMGDEGFEAQDPGAIFRNMAEGARQAAQAIGEDLALAMDAFMEKTESGAVAALEWGEAIGAAMGSAIAGQRSFLSALGPIMNRIIDEFQRMAIAAIMASIAADPKNKFIGLAAIALVAAGAAAMKAMFSSLGGGGGGVSISSVGGAVGPQGRGGQLQDQVVQVSGEIMAKGSDLSVLIYNDDKISTRTTGDPRVIVNRGG